MKTVRVTAIPGGWMLDDEITGVPLVFRSGGAAERKAKELARLHARLGEPAEVVVQDRGGTVVGSVRVS